MTVHRGLVQVSVKSPIPGPGLGIISLLVPRLLWLITRPEWNLNDFIFNLLVFFGISRTIVRRFAWKLIWMCLNGKRIKYLESFCKVYWRDQLVDGLVPEVVREDEQALVNLFRLKKEEIGFLWHLSSYYKPLKSRLILSVTYCNNSSLGPIYKRFLNKNIRFIWSQISGPKVIILSGFSVPLWSFTAYPSY